MGLIGEWFFRLSKSELKCLKLKKQITLGTPNFSSLILLVTGHRAFANNCFGTTEGHCTSIAGHCAVTGEYFAAFVPTGTYRGSAITGQAAPGGGLTHLVTSLGH